MLPLDPSGRRLSKVKLSEFYSKGQQRCDVTDRELYPDYIKIENGELYVDEERDLYYKSSNSNIDILLCSDVGEWKYFDDQKIVCAPYYLDSVGDANYIRIVDISGNQKASGTLTQFGLVYRADNYIIKENSEQETQIIFDLQGSQNVVEYWDDSFSIVMSYPHSNIMYNKFYDYDGNYLESKTNNQFIYLVWRELKYAFINHRLFSELLSKDSFSVRQRNTLSEIEHIIFESKSITYETLERIISLIEDIGFADKYAVQGYKKIKEILVAHNINNEIVKPLLNIMILNQSGEFGRRTHKWISLMNTRRLEKMAERSQEEFKNIIYDIDLLWEKMKTV